MSRKFARRAERQKSLGRRLAAGATAVLLALGVSVGASGVAVANPNSSIPTPVVTGNIEKYEQRGLTCNDFPRTLSDNLNLQSDNESGSYTAPAGTNGSWGSITWTAGNVLSWNIAPNWTVDLCIKGSTTVIWIKGATGTGSYDFKGLQGHGISHVNFRDAVYTPPPPPVKPDDLVTFSVWVDGVYDCGDTTVEQTRTKTTTTYQLVNNVWVAQQPTSVTETQTRNLTQEELDALASECVPPKPDDLVTFSVWVDGVYDCGDTTVEQTRTKTTTTYQLVNNVWVAQQPTSVTETQTRNLTQEELDALASECVPPKPDDLVTFSVWVDGVYDCGDTTVEQTRTKTTTTYQLVNNVWVAQQPTSVTETQTRNLTQEELDALALECLPTLGTASVTFNWTAPTCEVPGTVTVNSQLTSNATLLPPNSESPEGTFVFEAAPNTRFNLIGEPPSFVNPTGAPVITSQTVNEAGTQLTVVVQIPSKLSGPKCDLPTEGTASVTFDWTTATCARPGTVTVNPQLTSNATLLPPAEGAPAGTFVFQAAPDAQFSAAEPPVFVNPTGAPTITSATLNESRTQLTVVVQIPAKLTGAACGDLPTLAITGVNGALTTVGVIALLITLAGIGAVVAGRRVEV